MCSTATDCWSKLNTGDGLSWVRPHCKVTDVLVCPCLNTKLAKLKACLTWIKYWLKTSKPDLCCDHDPVKTVGTTRVLSMLQRYGKLVMSRNNGLLLPLQQLTVSYKDTHHMCALTDFYRIDAAGTGSSWLKQPCKRSKAMLHASGQARRKPRRCMLCSGKQASGKSFRPGSGGLKSAAC